MDERGGYENRRVVAALFNDRDRATRAVRDLRSRGFEPDEIGIVMRDRSEQGELIPDSGFRTGAASGALGGGVLGGVLGLLVGAGVLAIPGVGPVIAGGVLASTLGVTGGTAAAGAGIGAATGGILGALIALGVPHEDARFFERGIREGGTLVAVHAGSRSSEAGEALVAHGGSLSAVRHRPRHSPRVFGEIAHATSAARGETDTAAKSPWAGAERRMRAVGRRRSDN
ncbi:MAG TPA: general stress protein [Gemmatimonadales bacterium]